MINGCCFECGKTFVRCSKGEPIFVEKNHHGNIVKMHKDCAKFYDKRESLGHVTCNIREEPMGSDDFYDEPDIDPSTELDF